LQSSNPPPISLTKYFAQQANCGLSGNVLLALTPAFSVEICWGSLMNVSFIPIQSEIQMSMNNETISSAKKCRSCDATNTNKPQLSFSVNFGEKSMIAADLKDAHWTNKEVYNQIRNMELLCIDYDCSCGYQCNNTTLNCDFEPGYDRFYQYNSECQSHCPPK